MSNRTLKFLVLALGGLGALSRPAAGQKILDSRLGAAASELRVGSSVRVAAVGAHLEGQIVHGASDSLSLKGATGERRVALASIDTLWVRQRNTRRGAVFGAIVGGVIGAALGIPFIDALCEESSCADEYPKAIGVLSVLGASSGAAMGAGIGIFTQHWRRLYP